TCARAAGTAACTRRRRRARLRWRRRATARDHEGTSLAVTSVSEAVPRPTLRGRFFRRWLPIGLVLVALAVALAVGAAFLFDPAYEGRVPPGVSGDAVHASRRL